MSQLPLLCLDLGTRLGWATRELSGSVNFWSDPYDQAIDNHARLFDRFSAWLGDQVFIHKPAVLVLEKNPALKGAAAPVLLGLRAVALVIGYRHELVLDELPNLGRRPADKSDENDAKRLLARWDATRAHLIREAA